VDSLLKFFIYLYRSLDRSATLSASDIYVFIYLFIYLFICAVTLNSFLCLLISIFCKFLPGNVEAEFDLLFKKRLYDEQALAPLKNGIEGGKMGSLDVYRIL